jgi:hypothetical protein
VSAAHTARCSQLRTITTCCTIACLLTGGVYTASGIAGGGGPALVRLWDCRTKKCVGHFLAHAWGLHSLAFSADDRLLCTVGGDAHRRTQVGSELFLKTVLWTVPLIHWLLTVVLMRVL